MRVVNINDLQTTTVVDGCYSVVTDKNGNTKRFPLDRFSYAVLNVGDFPNYITEQDVRTAKEILDKKGVILIYDPSFNYYTPTQASYADRGSQSGLIIKDFGIDIDNNLMYFKQYTIPDTNITTSARIIVKKYDLSSIFLQQLNEDVEI